MHLMYHNCSNNSLSINIWIKVWCGEIVMNWLHKNIFFYLFLFWQSWNETFNFHVIKAGSVTSCWTKISGIKQTFSGYDWDLVIQSFFSQFWIARVPPLESVTVRRRRQSSDKHWSGMETGYLFRFPNGPWNFGSHQKNYHKNITLCAN